MVPFGYSANASVINAVHCIPSKAHCLVDTSCICQLQLCARFNGHQMQQLIKLGDDRLQKLTHQFTLPLKPTAPPSTLTIISSSKKCQKLFTEVTQFVPKITQKVVNEF